MKKKILYIILSLLCLYGLNTLAQTVFNIDDAFFVETGFNTGDFSPLHFHFSGNDFYGLMVWGTGTSTTQDLELSGSTIACSTQISGLYFNPARGNRIWPLDKGTLAILSGSNSFVGYDSLSITGGFFTDCNGTGINSDEIYGYIKHTYLGIDYEIWAGIDYDWTTGDPISTRSGSLKYITVPNNTASGYIFDNNGGITQVQPNSHLYASAVFTGNEVIYITPHYVTTGTNITISIFSNKDTEYKISGDIISSLTGSLTARVNKDIIIDLPNLIGTKDIEITISTGTESIKQNLSVYLEDMIPPTVNLQSPSSGTIINGNTTTLNWTGSDNIGISHYSIYVDGPTQYFWPQIQNKTQQDSGPLSDGTYSRYVIATDYGNNTGKSEVWTFTISNPILGPSLISPSSGDNVYIGNVNLLWNTTNNNSGYTWQIASNNTFTNIIANGSTNNTGINILHHPNFMTGTFYWRVIDNKTAGTSEHRKINIIDITGGVITQIQPINLGIITGAQLSKVYSSNTGIISGLTNNVAVLAKLENNIGALFINNVMVGNQSLVKNNDQIRIELISSNKYNTSVSTKLIVGAGNSIISGKFEVYTSTGYEYNIGSGNLSNALKIQAILFVNSIAEMYKNNPHTLAQFLTTFKAILKDKIDILEYSILNTSNVAEKDLLELQKESITYLMFVVNEKLNEIDYSQSNIYIAPNGKQYHVQYNDTKLAYTSPNFIYPKYFPTREAFKHHIDINNPGNYYSNIYGDTITAPNNKIYTIHIENGKWTSSNMLHKKYFDTREQIIEHIVINNPASTRDHNIDTSFTPIVFIAPNGKSYTIFKTASSGNNPNKYSSFMFVAPKYFSSVESAKNHIVNSNQK